MFILSQAFDFFKSISSRLRMEGVEFTSTPSILRPEKYLREVENPRRDEGV
jgi:hypothetical protein